jgi:methionine-rich copper-binding protein CopC
MMRKFKMRIMATVIAALGSLGIYFYPGELKLMEALPAHHEKISAIEDNELELLFNRPVDAAKCSVQVIDPNDKMITEKLETYKGVLLQVKTKSPYRPYGYVPGSYNVRWACEAMDGKKADGSYHFHMEDHHAKHGQAHPNDPKKAEPHKH